MSDEKIIINPRTPTKKVTKLRVIDEADNRYNVAGKLIQLGRAIRDGKYDKVTDVVVGVRRTTPTKEGPKTCVSGFHFGQGTEGSASVTVDTLKSIICG